MMNAAIDRLIEILTSAGQRKRMYFQPVNPMAVMNFLGGLRTGCSLFGLEWNSEDRRPALERRGLELRSCWEWEQLQERGLGPEASIDEILAIEIENWQETAARLRR